MSRQILTDAERIDALENKCALLAVSLRQAEAEGVQKARMAANIAIDCADVFSKQSEWHLTLYQAIGKFVDQGEYESNGLSFADRNTVSGLASIGAYLADGGYGLADSYRRQAEGLAVKNAAT